MGRQQAENGVSEEGHVLLAGLCHLLKGGNSLYRTEDSSHPLFVEPLRALPDAAAQGYAGDAGALAALGHAAGDLSTGALPVDAPLSSEDHVRLRQQGVEVRAVQQEIGAGKKVTVQRSKGLGENEPDMMWLTTMNPETRRLIKVMPEDVERTAQVFDLLLGDNLQGRKDHIAENGYKYLELADIS